MINETPWVCLTTIRNETANDGGGHLFFGSQLRGHAPTNWKTERCSERPREPIRASRQSQG